MVKIYTIANVPDELVQAWVQHLRNFDIAHPGCHFRVVSRSDDGTVAEMMELLDKVWPPLPVRHIIRGTKQ